MYCPQVEMFLKCQPTAQSYISSNTTTNSNIGNFNVHNITINSNTGRNSPVNEGSLAVHEVKLVVEIVPGLLNCCCVCEHTTGALHVAEITASNHCGFLVVDAHLESGRAPVDELKWKRCQLVACLHMRL